MIKHRSSFVLIAYFVCVVLFASCDNQGGDHFVLNAFEQNSIHEAQTKNYALYASSIVESKAADASKHVYHDMDIALRFPQISYSNDYAEYDEDIESHINRVLFAQSIGNEENFLVNRDNRELVEFETNYTITMANDDMFSVKYYGHIYSISHAISFCYGTTVNAVTGEIAEVSDYIAIDDSLVALINNGSVEYFSAPEYDKATVERAVSEFIENQSIVPHQNNCFYISDDRINLIIPVNQGNRNYVILSIEVN